MAEISVDVQPTPNPNSLKLTLSTQVIDKGSKTYASKEAAAASPLAAAIFRVDGVVSVFMLGNFVTVSKRPDGDWVDIGPAVAKAIAAYYAEA